MGSHLSTPLVLNPGNLHVANKHAALLSEATTCGGFGGGLLLHHGGFGSGLLHLFRQTHSCPPYNPASSMKRFIMFGRCAVYRSKISTDDPEGNPHGRVAGNKMSRPKSKEAFAIRFWQHLSLQHLLPCIGTCEDVQYTWPGSNWRPSAC